MAPDPGDEDDLLPLEVGRRFDLQRDLGLVVGIDLFVRPTRTAAARRAKEASNSRFVMERGSARWVGNRWYMRGEPGASPTGVYA
jgi:hypothetical protein